MITYVKDTITVKLLIDRKTIVDRQVEAFVAEGVGLAYHGDPRTEEEAATVTTIMVTHIGTGGRVCNWEVETVEEARDWIAALDEVIDWTGQRPRFRHGMENRILYLVAIGALNNIEDPS